MALMLVLGLSLVAASGVLALRAVGLTQTQRRRALDQIAVYGFRAGTAEEARDSRETRNILGGIASAAGEKALARFDSLRAGEQNMRRLLNTAGMYQTSVAAYIGSRIVGLGSGVGMFMLLLLSGNFDLRIAAGCVMLIVMGWFMPLVRVQRRARLRTEQIDREVPELVDLLVTTVEGGVGFAAGLQLASRSIEGPLGQELRLALREQSLGLSPEEAFRNLSTRVDSPATQMFTQALLQGESLGVSIGGILRDLAIDMRKRRRQVAEERAQKTPTKILFPLVGLILPAMFIVTLGPVLMEAITFFATA